MPHTFTAFVSKNKAVVGLIGVVIIGGGYVLTHRGSTKPLQYTLTAASKQTIVTSVTAAGQVSGENQLDVKPTVSGAITKVFVKPGDSVTTSTALFAIDATDAERTVRDAVQTLNNARLSTQSAVLSLQKLQQPPDTLALTQAQNAVDQAQRALDTLKKGPDPLDVEQAQHSYQVEADKIALSDDGVTPNMIRTVYDAAVPTIKSTSLSLQSDLRDVQSAFDTLLQTNYNNSYEYSRLLSTTDPNSSTGDNLYHNVQQQNTVLKPQSEALTITGENTATIDATLVSARTAMVSASLFLQKMDDSMTAVVPSGSLSQSSLDALRNTIHADHTDAVAKISALTAAIQDITNAKSSFHAEQVNVEKLQVALDKLNRGSDPNDIATAQERLNEVTASLAKLRQGATAIDLANAQNAIAQRRADEVTAQNRLADAQQALSNYTIHAAFDGVMATVPVRVGDQASPSTSLGSLLTNTKIVTIPLNEVDVSKVHVGQKATLTFDALPDLSIAGTVTQIDTLGTVSQGVVNYNVKVAFLTEDDRVKPGMSTSVSIITDLHADVIAVPNAAIHQTNGQITVSILTTAQTAPVASSQNVTASVAPEVRPVQIGIANDQYTEVTSGLQEGEQVITRTIDPNTTSAASSASRTGSTLGIPGVGGGGFGGGAGGIRTGGGRAGG